MMEDEDNLCSCNCGTEECDYGHYCRNCGACPRCCECEDGYGEAEDH
jgi:hypothetical protein